VDIVPLFDLHWISSLINEKSLEQAGIISNFFAGIFLAIEYFVMKERIDKLNDRLELSISNAYSGSLKIVKLYAKWKRWIFLIITAAIISIAIYQAIYNNNASVMDYFVYYHSMAKTILVPLRRILLASLVPLFIMFVILFIARSTPRKTLGALGILLYIVGNILLFLHTISS